MHLPTVRRLATLHFLEAGNKPCMRVSASCASTRYQAEHGSWASACVLQARYAEEPFVHVMDKGGVPHTRYVRGTNYNFISVFPDRLPGRAIVISGARIALCMLLSQALFDIWVFSS